MIKVRCSHAPVAGFRQGRGSPCSYTITCNELCVLTQHPTQSCICSPVCDWTTWFRHHSTSLANPHLTTVSKVLTSPHKTCHFAVALSRRLAITVLPQSELLQSLHIPIFSRLQDINFKNPAVRSLFIISQSWTVPLL